MASSSNTAALDAEALNGMVAEFEDFSMVETDGVERMEWFFLLRSWRRGIGIYVGRFLFQFAHEADVCRVMEGGPWNFDNHLLIFQRVKTGEDPMKVDLEHIFLWMQVHNLPVGYRSERVVRSLGKYICGWIFRI